jgi:hypothetical protein
MSTDLHRDTLVLVEGFVADNGHEPSLKAEDPAELNLAVWRSRALTVAHRSKEQRWRRVMEQVRQLTQFQEHHHCMPAGGSDDRAEASLARWAKAHLDQRHPHPLVLHLAAKHDWGTRPTVRQVEELKSIVDAHGRLPGPSCRTQHEWSLWSWVLGRMERGTVAPEAQRIIDEAGGYRSHLLQHKALRNHRTR